MNNIPIKIERTPNFKIFMYDQFNFVLICKVNISKLVNCKIAKKLQIIQQLGGLGLGLIRI